MNLEKLENLDHWQLEHDSQDIRGRPLMGRTGDRLGTIDEMLVDREHERVAAVRLGNGEVYRAEALEIRDDGVFLGGADTETETPAAKVERGAKEERIPMAEEHLIVGKRDVDRGTIRVRSRTLEKPVSEDVRLREEHVDVERRPVNQPIDNDSGIFKDRSVEMTAKGEEAVVGKETVVTDELVVRKDVGERVEHIDETVRKTEVDVDDRGR